MEKQLLAVYETTTNRLPAITRGLSMQPRQNVALRLIAETLISDDGCLRPQALPVIRNVLNHPRDLPIKRALAAHRAHVLPLLEALQVPDAALTTQLNSICQHRHAHPVAARLVRLTLGLSHDSEVGAREARVAALLTMLTPLRQPEAAGNCWLVAPQIAIQQMNPLRMCRELQSMLETGTLSWQHKDGTTVSQPIAPHLYRAALHDASLSTWRSTETLHNEPAVHHALVALGVRREKCESLFVSPTSSTSSTRPTSPSSSTGEHSVNNCQDLLQWVGEKLNRPSAQIDFACDRFASELEPALLQAWAGSSAYFDPADHDLHTGAHAALWALLDRMPKEVQADLAPTADQLLKERLGEQYDPNVKDQTLYSGIRLVDRGSRNEPADCQPIRGPDDLGKMMHSVLHEAAQASAAAEVSTHPETRPLHSTKQVALQAAVQPAAVAKGLSEWLSTQNAERVWAIRQGYGNWASIRYGIDDPNGWPGISPNTSWFLQRVINRLKDLRPRLEGLAASGRPIYVGASTLSHAFNVIASAPTLQSAWRADETASTWIDRHLQQPGLELRMVRRTEPPLGQLVEQLVPHLLPSGSPAEVERLQAALMTDACLADPTDAQHSAQEHPSQRVYQLTRLAEALSTHWPPALRGTERGAALLKLDQLLAQHVPPPYVEFLDTNYVDPGGNRQTIAAAFIWRTGKIAMCDMSYVDAKPAFAPLDHMRWARLFQMETRIDHVLGFEAAAAR